MQHHAADQLHIEMAHAQHPPAGFTDDGESLRQDLVQHGSLVVQGAGVGKALPEVAGSASQVVIGEGSDLLLQKIDIGDDRLIALQLAGIGVTQQELEHGNRQIFWGSDY